MAEIVSDSRDSKLSTDNKRVIAGIVPILDNAIDSSHSVEEFVNIALVGVISMAVGSFVGSLFKNK